MNHVSVPASERHSNQSIVGSRGRSVGPLWPVDYATFLATTMIRRRTGLSRALAAFTALATSWCLGCSAFELLIDAATGGKDSSGMVCASEGGHKVGAASSVMETAGATSTIHALPDEDGGATAMLCGCDGCFAPSPIAAALATIPSPPLVALPATLVTPPSVDRAPLVPPPQASA